MEIMAVNSLSPKTRAIYSQNSRKLSHLLYVLLDWLTERWWILVDQSEGHYLINAALYNMLV